MAADFLPPSPARCTALPLLAPPRVLVLPCFLRSLALLLSLSLPLPFSLSLFFQYTALPARLPASERRPVPYPPGPTRPVSARLSHLTPCACHGRIGHLSWAPPLHRPGPAWRAGAPSNAPTASVRRAEARSTPTRPVPVTATAGTGALSVPLPTASGAWDEDGPGYGGVGTTPGSGVGLNKYTYMIAHLAPPSIKLILHYFS